MNQTINPTINQAMYQNATSPRLRYQTVDFGKIDVHICTLRSNQEFYDPDRVAAKLGISSATWPIFGVIWPSGMVLAHYMHSHDTGTKRVLEIGCGTALTSLLLNKQNVDITATDYHPEVEHFLNRNTKLNNNDQIPFERTGWADKNDTLGKFDLIIGSDLLYEDEHTNLLADFIFDHSEPHCEVILVDPDRGRKSKLSTKMGELGYSTTFIKVERTDFLEKPFKGHILKFERCAV